jgi:sulfatase maturation enzyme AslB (radical SAM superfamily)
MTRGSIWMRMLTKLVARYYLGKPDQAEILFIKYPYLGDLWPALMNEAAFRFKTRRSYRLTALNVELTNRCNLACSLCPRSADQPREERDMDFETFRSIIDASPGIRTLLPYQWGEPLLSPILFKCIAYASGRNIRTMVTTNAVLLDDEVSRRLVDAGLTRLTVSFDGSLESHARIRGVDAGEIKARVERFKKVRDGQGAACRLDVSMVVDERTEKEREAFRALFEPLADRIQFIPRFISGNRKDRCRELWRGGLVILADGDATVCCVDDQGLLRLGNVKDHSPPELFNGPAMQALRRNHARLDFPTLCRHCAEYDAPGVSARFS